MSKQVYIPLLLLFFAIDLSAQIIQEKNVDDEEKIFEKVNIEAHTNEKAWSNHINKLTQLPDSIKKNIPAGTYKVFVQFVIDIHGSMGQIKVKNDPGFGLAKIALKAVSTYKGEWKPANQCGRNVKAYREQPVVFIIPAQ